MTPSMTPSPFLAWLRRVGLALMLATLSAAGAETRDIVAEGTSETCWGRERAVDQARVHAKNDAHAECRALGKGWSYGSQSFAGYVQCNRCGTSEEFRCTIKQTVHTCVNLQKEQEAAAARQRAEQAAQNQAEKDRAAREKAQAAQRDKELKDKADRDRAERDRLTREQADRDRIRQRMADGEKAAKAAREKAVTDPLDQAFSERQDKARQPKPAGSSTGDTLDDAFSSRQGSGARPKASAGTGDVLDDALQQRADRLAERERQAVLKSRTEAATASCQAAAKGVDACLQSACGREPAKTHCTDGTWESTSCKASPGTRCLNIQQYVCRTKEPNPAHEKWQSCTATSRAQCALPGTVEDCVRQRLQAAK